MNRPIKFRAFQEKHSKMVHGDMLFINGVSDGGSASIDTTISNLQLEYKLMQFTGVLDKNGKEIYEEDILKDELGIGLVKFLSPAFVAVVENGDVFSLAKGKVNVTQLEQTEVIGNKYKNPELLTS